MQSADKRQCHCSFLLSDANRLGNRAAGQWRTSKVIWQQEALDAAGNGGAIRRQLLQQRGYRDHLVEWHHLQAPACPRRISYGFRCGHQQITRFQRSPPMLGDRSTHCERMCS